MWEIRIRGLYWLSLLKNSIGGFWHGRFRLPPRAWILCCALIDYKSWIYLTPFHNDLTCYVSSCNLKIKINAMFGIILQKCHRVKITSITAQTEYTFACCCYLERMLYNIWWPNRTLVDRKKTDMMFCKLMITWKDFQVNRNIGLELALSTFFMCNFWNLKVYKPKEKNVIAYKNKTCISFFHLTFLMTQNKYTADLLFWFDTSKQLLHVSDGCHEDESRKPFKIYIACPKKCHHLDWTKKKRNYLQLDNYCMDYKLLIFSWCGK